MASCDIFSCVKTMFMSEEQYAQNAEENARGLIVMYGSHVIETQKNLDETLSVARMHLKALQAAREQKNGPAIARALAAAKETASRAKVLTTQRTKYEQLLASCERAVQSLQEGQQMKKTVRTLVAVRRQFKVLELGGLADSAESTISDLTASNEEVSDIRNLVLGGMQTTVASDPDADMAELEELLLAETPSSNAVEEPPQKQEICGVRLPSSEAYSAAMTA